VLSGKETAVLSEEKQEAIDATGRDGVRVEVVRPSDACFSSGGGFPLSTAGGDRSLKKEEGWLNLFCPNDSCEIDQPGGLV